MGFLEWIAINELRSRNAAMLKTSKARRRAHATQSDRRRELEAELGRVSLLAFALAELCIDKGVLTVQELDARLKALDAADGAEDEKLAPGRALPGLKSVRSTSRPLRVSSAARRASSAAAPRRRPD